MYELKKMERYLRVNLLGPGPRLMKKRIYRAAVSQRLGNTALMGLHFLMENNLQNKIDIDTSQQILKHINKPSLFWDVMWCVSASVYLHFRLSQTIRKQLPKRTVYSPGNCSALQPHLLAHARIRWHSLCAY